MFKKLIFVLWLKLHWTFLLTVSYIAAGNGLLPFAKHYFSSYYRICDLFCKHVFRWIDWYDLLGMKMFATNVEDFSVCIFYNCDEIDGSILIL